MPVRRLLLSISISLAASLEGICNPHPPGDEGKMPGMALRQTAITLLLGVSDIGEVPQDDLEHLEMLLNHPLKLNHCSRHELEECALFSSYQAAAIEDYRGRNGDIISVAELAAVDGFNPERAAILSPFISFLQEQSIAVGKSPGIGLEGGVSAGGACKISGGKDSWQWWTYAQGALSLPFCVTEVYVGLKSPWAKPVRLPDDVGWTVRIMPSGKAERSFAGRHTVQLCGGNFNLRVGQGLGLWSGNVMTSYSSPDALMRSPTGLSPYSGASPSDVMLGVAATLRFGPVEITPFADWRGHRLGGSASWYHRNGNAGILAYYNNGSTDISLNFQQSIRHIVLYGEAAYSAPCSRAASGSAPFSAVSGIRFPFFKADCALRACYSPDEHSICASRCFSAAAGKLFSSAGCILSYYPVAKGHTSEGSYKLKISSQYLYHPSPAWSILLKSGARIQWEKAEEPGDAAASYRSATRLEMRGEGEWSLNGYLASLRCDMTYFDTFGCALTSIQGKSHSAANGRFSIDAQMEEGVFFVENWDGRVYYYRRDAPRAYNMLQLYGNGYFLGAYVKMTMGRHFRIYSRIDWVHKCWNPVTEKPSLCVKLQLTCDW